MKRYLIVVENKTTKERFLHNPFKNEIIPIGYASITETVPLNENRYGHLPLLTS